MSRPRQTLEALFASRYRVEPNGCWRWTGQYDGVGYGKIVQHRGAKAIGAHRLGFMLRNGPIPAGLFACHHCDNRWCVNPDHIFLGTQADNLRDAHRKGRLNVPTKGWKREITHCPKGHAYDAANTRHTTQAMGRAMRVCKACARARATSYNYRNRVAIAAKARAYRARRKAAVCA